MTRMLIPLVVADVSSFAKALNTSLNDRAAEGKSKLSHVDLLQLLSRAAGHRNFQTLRAAVQPHKAEGEAHPDAGQSHTMTGAEVLAPDGERPAVDYATLSPLVRKALMQFDTAGRLVRLPNKLSVQQLTMWWMWTHFVVRRKYTENEVNLVLNAHHTFGDQATLRRELINMKLMGRESDCSQYWKEPVRPSEEAQQFLRALRQAVSGAQSRRALSMRKAH